jgi:hypothetical protein
MTTDAATALETLVDRHGLANVIEALAIVCSEKADHIQTNWQNTVLAGSWERCSHQLDTVAARVKARGL